MSKYLSYGTDVLIIKLEEIYFWFYDDDNCLGQFYFNFKFDQYTFQTITFYFDDGIVNLECQLIKYVSPIYKLVSVPDQYKNSICHPFCYYIYP